jgi:hypothetical protein
MAAISSAWSRITGRGAAGGKTLPADLKRITHSGVLDIPKELLTPVIDASNNEEDRPEIMKHLRECLAEPKGDQWRRVYGGLVLCEALVKQGSPALLTETAEGRHFDLVQRLSFLEQFDYTDKRVMNNVRRKAEALRKEVVPLLQATETASIERSKDFEDTKDTASTCSPGSSAAASTVTRASTISSQTAGMKGFGSDDIRPEDTLDSDPAEANRGKFLNNMVKVGHSDDTTDESGDDKKPAPVKSQEPRKMTAKARNERSRRRRDQDSSSGSDSDASQASAPKSKPAPQAPAQTVDLLDL